MRWTFARSLFALATAPALFLVSSSALASSPCAVACNFVADPSTCTLELEGGCEAQCTPISVVADCDGQCDVDASASCTESCSGSCMTQCSANPGSFSCSGQCESDCNGSCSSSCTDSACMSDCAADCSNRCEVQCDAVAPSATCDTQCEASCNGSCQVQANIDCHASCTVKEQGGCQASCQEPGVAIFCDGNYVTESEAASCYSCLVSNGFSASASVTCTNGQCSGAAGVCSVGAVGSSKDGWGMLGMTGLMMGLGLVVSRRRKSN